MDHDKIDNKSSKEDDTHNKISNLVEDYDDFLSLFRSGIRSLHHYPSAIANYSANDAVERLKRAGLTPRRQEDRVYFDDPAGRVPRRRRSRIVPV